MGTKPNACLPDLEDGGETKLAVGPPLQCCVSSARTFPNSTHGTWHAYSTANGRRSGRDKILGNN